MTLACTLILLAAFRSELTRPQFAVLCEQRPLRLGLDRAARHPVRPGARRPVALALRLDLAPDAHGDRRLVGVDPGAGARAITPFCWRSRRGCSGLFASLDVVLFYIFFEFTLIPLFFLIGIWGGPQRRRAAVTFFLYTLAGSLLTLLGVIALVVVHYQYSPGNVLTFSIPELTHGLAALAVERVEERRTPGRSPQVLIFLLLLAGFAIKVPMFPFHTWLPLAHVEAPTAGSILLAGVLLKVGSYGLLRFNIGMTPLGAAAMFPLLATLAVIGIIYGALAALAQTDIKRLVAYSSVSHMGFIVLGMFALERHRARRLDDPDDQSWAHDRGAVRLRGHDLRAVPHPRHERARRAVEPAADPGLLLDPGRARLGGGAGFERVRGRVSDPGRHVRQEPARGRAGRHRA